MDAHFSTLHPILSRLRKMLRDYRDARRQGLGFVSMKKQKEMNHVEEGERSGRINLSCPYFDPTVNDDLAVRINVVFRTVPPISKYKI